MKHCFVSYYSRAQRFGGREEGGWYYHRDYAMSCRRFRNRRAALRYMRMVARVLGLGNRDEDTGAWPVGIPAGQRLGDRNKTGKMVSRWGQTFGWWLEDGRHGEGDWISVSRLPREFDESHLPRPHYE